MKKAISFSRLPMPGYPRNKKKMDDERLCVSEDLSTYKESDSPLAAFLQRCNSLPAKAWDFDTASTTEPPTCAPIPSSPISIREPSSPSSTREPLSPSSSLSDDWIDQQCPSPLNVSPAQRTKVLLHVYDMDQTFGVINRQLLEHRGMGVFHVGVEVYNQEYWFSGEEHASRTGVRKCVPKTLFKEHYRETIEVGWTRHTKAETEAIVRCLCSKWLNKEYHLIRRNCISFSQELCERLGLQDKFPAHLKNVCDFIQESSVLTAIVDGTWSAKQWWNAGEMPTDRPVVESTVTSI